MSIPIVLAVFGTSGPAKKTYDSVENQIKKQFPQHPVYRAYTSRIIGEKQAKKNPARKNLGETLYKLKEDGHSWTVIQSMHLVCGHEFYRLVDESRDACPDFLRISVGLPLLTSVRDFEEVADILADETNFEKDEAVVFIGHGTDHPSWTVYPALEAIMRNRHGNRFFFGTLEGGYPGLQNVLSSLRKNGFNKAVLAPFLLVSGYHFQKDINGEEQSWKNVFQQNGIRTRAIDEGLGANERIISLFGRHIREALDIIPPNNR